MGKQSKSKAKTKSTAAKTTAVSESQALLIAANAVEDMMVDFQPFSRYARHNVDVSIANQHAAHLSDAIKQQILALFEANMKQMYLQSDWGYDPKQKGDELFESDARYLVASTNDDQLVGFVHFRFVEDDGVEVLYIYEIQIADSMQRKGLGKFLMQLLLLVARKYGMKLVVLTVFKFNTAAMEFYCKKLGFSIDETSPSASGDYSQSYEILSKVVDPSYR